jgi:hypothetical protein
LFYCSRRSWFSLCSRFWQYGLKAGTHWENLIMPTGRYNFRPTDGLRLIRCAKAAGLRVKAITLRDGKPYLEIHHGEGADDAAKPNPLDRVLDDAQDQKRTA